MYFNYIKIIMYAVTRASARARILAKAGKNNKQTNPNLFK